MSYDIWRRVCFVQTHILITTNHRSIWYPGQTSFFFLIIFLQTLFESTFLDWTLLRWPVFMWQTPIHHLFSVSSLAPKSEEIKRWVYFPKHVHLYIYLHRHTKISINFFSWVGGGLRCHMWGCTQKKWLDRALYFKVGSVCTQCACPHPSWASAAELSTRRFMFHRISRFSLAQGSGCYVWLEIMMFSNYNFGSGLWRDNRFSKIMRLLTHLIVATGRQLGLIFEQ